MKKNITIDKFLMEYCSMIQSSNFDSKNISIDEDINLSNSYNSIKGYIKEFAKFLNNLYDKGYVLSPSILKKIMDIIDYEEYAYSVLLKYIDIITINIPYYHNDIIIDHIDESILLDYINEYIRVMNENTNSIISDEKLPSLIPKQDKLLSVISETKDGLKSIEYVLLNPKTINDDTEFRYIFEGLYLLAKYNEDLFNNVKKHYNAKNFVSLIDNIII